MFRASHYGVLFSGICALILSLGIARYSFTPMIPVMQDQMGVTESLAGWLAGWNYMGYLTGLFLVWLMKDLKLKDFFFRYGLIIAVLATALMAAHENRLVWYVSRYFAGIASATGFMLGTGLVMNWLRHHDFRGELGLHFAGVGLGIIVGALVVDFTKLDALFAMNWRLQWLTLAGVGAIFMVLAMLFLPRPKDDEIEMARSRDMMRDVPEPSKTWLWSLQIAYFCAGFSNTLNVTFTSLIAELQPLEGMGARMWLLVGIAATPAPFLWDRISRKTGPLTALKAAFVLNIIGNMCLALSQSLITTSLAALIFGFTFMGIVSLTLSGVGRLYGDKATKVMAQLTFGYCIAQILSPIVAGNVVEITGSFTAPLYVVSGLMVLGLLCLFGIGQVDIQERS